MFIRHKSIKGKRYAYLVKNKWNKKRRVSKQKVVAYIGRVYSLDKIPPERFKQEIEQRSNQPKKENAFITLKTLIEVGLISNNFKQKKDTWSLNNFQVSLDRLSPSVRDSRTNQEVCLELNQGHISSYTLNNLFSLSNQPSGHKLTFGKKLGRALLSAGIELDNESFLKIFRLTYPKANTKIDTYHQKSTEFP